MSLKRLAWLVLLAAAFPALARAQAPAPSGAEPPRGGFAGETFVRGFAGETFVRGLPVRPWFEVCR